MRLLQINQMLSLSTLDIATEDTELPQSQGSLCCPLLRTPLQLGNELQVTEPLNRPFEATFAQMGKHHTRWHQKQCEPSATLKEGPSYGRWQDLVEHLSGHLLGSISCAHLEPPNGVGQRNGCHLYLEQCPYLVLDPPLLSGKPPKS